MTKKEKAEIEHLEWLVARRSEIQSLALRLLILRKDRRFATKRAAQGSGTLDLMIGVVYSLWRAVFLAHAKREGKNIPDGAMNFLQTLIEDNAIGYAQEQKHRNWTVGFYVNNAKYRFREICEMDTDFKKILQEAGLYSAIADRSVKDIKPIWEKLALALELLALAQELAVKKYEKT